MKINKVTELVSAFGALICVIGILSAVAANILGIGYGLYLMGPGGLEIGMALWGGFSLWIKLISAGFISTVFGFILMSF